MHAAVSFSWSLIGEISCRMLAVEDRDETLIKLLVDEGADVFTIKNAESETANEMALRLLQKSLK